MASFQGLLARWLPEYGCEADEALVAKLARYLELVTEAQGRVRLVGSVEPEVLVKRHVGESVALLRLRPGISGRLVDVGSGAGFPGLVLALARPELKTTLVEATQKKAAFLQQAVAELGLGERVRIENRFLERQPPRGNREPVAGASLVTVRALEGMEEAPRWLGRWLDPEAEVAFWVTRELAEQWRRQYAMWDWGEFAPLPGAHSRGILLASVPRETLSHTPRAN